MEKKESLSAQLVTDMSKSQPPIWNAKVRYL